MDNKKNNILAGNETTIDPTENVISAYVTNSLTQYNVPTGYGYDILDEENVINAKAWVDENHK